MLARVTPAGQPNVFAGAGRNHDVALGEHPPFSTTIARTIFTFTHIHFCAGYLHEFASHSHYFLHPTDRAYCQ